MTLYRTVQGFTKKLNSRLRHDFSHLEHMETCMPGCSVEKRQYLHYPRSYEEVLIDFETGFEINFRYLVYRHPRRDGWVVIQDEFYGSLGKRKKVLELADQKFFNSLLEIFLKDVDHWLMKIWKKRCDSFIFAMRTCFLSKENKRRIYWARKEEIPKILEELGI